MSWAHVLQIVLLCAIAAGLIPLIRRRRNRYRRGVLPPPSHLCRRASEEHLLDKPTRSVP